MDTEKREELPPDDGAVEESGTGELGGAAWPAARARARPAGRTGHPSSPAKDPTADEATGITGDPDEG